MSLLSRALGRLDNWLNLVTGAGVNSGRTAFQFRASAGDFLDLATLEVLYDLDGIAARIVDAVPKHALRQGLTIQTGDEVLNSALTSTLADLGAEDALRKAWTWARLYGGGAVFVGADDGRDPRFPLDLGSLQRVRFLVDVDRRDLTPHTWVTDPLSPRFGDVDTFLLLRQGGMSSTTSVVHASRLLRFYGTEVSRRRRLELQGWGDSVLQRVYQELQQTRGAFAAVATLLQDSSQGVFKVKDLFALMAADSTDAVKKRLELMDLSRSMAKSILVDADSESYERVETTTLTGVVEVLDRFVNFLAAVTEMPVTVLMGQAPAGLNATGESDVRSWYDTVRTEQAKTLRPRVERLVRMLLRSRQGPTAGIEPEGWRVDFPPLWQPTPSEQADLRAKTATTDVAYIQAGVLTPEEVALSRFPREGWSPETAVDLDARRAAQEADREATADPSPSPGTAGAPA